MVVAYFRLSRNPNKEVKNKKSELEIHLNNKLRELYNINYKNMIILKYLVWNRMANIKVVFNLNLLSYLADVSRWW